MIYGSIEQDISTNKENKKSPKRIIALFAFCLLAVIVFLNKGSNTITSVAFEQTNAGLKPYNGQYFTVSVSNFYTQQTGLSIGGGLLNKWNLVVEPYKTSKFSAASLTEDTTDSTLEWQIDGTIYDGFDVEHVFTETGSKTVVLALTKDGQMVATERFDIMVKYVRREIRSLSTEDLTSFITALQVVYTTSLEEGSELYGDSYKGISYYVSSHLFAACLTDCDHWHDDAGFYPSHSAITLAFEQNLQLIDPSVTIPYWDFEIDAENLGSSWSESTLFTEDYFGSVPTLDDGNDDHAVIDGPFAYLPIIQTDESVISNAYGLLRSKWNNNPTPYLTRLDTIIGSSYQSTFPSCSMFAETVKQTSFASFSYFANGGAHGPVHILAGGQWDIDNHILTSFQLQNEQLLLFKDLWRKGYATCPDSCSEESSTDDCGCGVSSMLSDKSNYDILNESGMLDYIPLKGIESDDDYEQLVEALTYPGIAGELFSSSAPYDPLFWVIHPTIERLLYLKRIQLSDGLTTFDETWGYAHDSTNPSDFYSVCDWTQLDSYALPSCEEEISCSGHLADDVMFFGNYLGEGESYTNSEFYEFIDPLNDDNPVTYDTFTWSVCEELGYHF